jgi:uncharacterized protein (DUF1810 family)
MDLSPSFDEGTGECTWSLDTELHIPSSAVRYRYVIIDEKDGRVLREECKIRCHYLSFTHHRVKDHWLNRDEASELVLCRILNCQNGEDGETKYDTALSEIKEGRKVSHWIWYVWPTLDGVRETMRRDLHLPSILTAQIYLHHDVLRERLLQITRAATIQLVSGVPPNVLFGAQSMYDAPKFIEACTCFLIAAKLEKLEECAVVFQEGLNASNSGKLHIHTVKIAKVPEGLL